MYDVKVIENVFFRSDTDTSYTICTYALRQQVCCTSLQPGSKYVSHIWHSITNANFSDAKLCMLYVFSIWHLHTSNNLPHKSLQIGCIECVQIKGWSKYIQGWSKYVQGWSKCDPNTSNDDQIIPHMITQIVPRLMPYPNKYGKTRSNINIENKSGPIVDLMGMNSMASWQNAPKHRELWNQRILMCQLKDQTWAHWMINGCASPKRGESRRSPYSYIPERCGCVCNAGPWHARMLSADITCESQRPDHCRLRCMHCMHFKDARTSWCTALQPLSNSTSALHLWQDCVSGFKLWMVHVISASTMHILLAPQLERHVCQYIFVALHLMNPQWN